MSYTGAGRERLLTQPAVSRQMTQLQEDLEVALFERVGRTLHLTEAGRALVERARRALAELERTAEAIRAHGTKALGTIRVGASTTPGLYLVPAILGAFAADYPDVEVDYRVDRSQGIEGLLLENAIDLGYVGAPLESAELRLEAIGHDEIVCVAAAGHPLGCRRSVAAQAVAEQIWVVRPRGSATRELVDRWFAERNLQPRRVIELPGAEDVKTLVAAGVGVGFTSLHGFGQQDVGRLTRLRVRGLDLRRPLYFAHHRHKHLTPAMVAFASRLSSSRLGAPRRRSS